MSKIVSIQKRIVAVAIFLRLGWYLNEQFFVVCNEILGTETAFSKKVVRQ